MFINTFMQKILLGMSSKQSCYNSYDNSHSCFRSGPQGTFKTSNFDNSDLSGIPAKILDTVENSCEEVMKIGKYI